MPTKKSASIGSEGYEPFAIASIILGVLSLFTLLFGLALGILAIIFGIIALNNIHRSHAVFGKGIAIAGIVLGSLGIIIGITLSVVVFYALFFFIEAFKSSPVDYIIPDSSMLNSSTSSNEWTIPADQEAILTNALDGYYQSYGTYPSSLLKFKENLTSDVFLHVNYSLEDDGHSYSLVYY